MMIVCGGACTITVCGGAEGAGAGGGGVCCILTFCCSLLFRFPACCARCRITWTAFITSCGMLKYASPRADVHDKFVAIWFSTSANPVSPLMLLSHGCWST